MVASSVGRRPRKAVKRGALAVAVALAVATVPFAPPADAAGLNLPVQMGQRFLGSASPAKTLALPLATKIGPIRPLAVAGINATTFSAIKVGPITVFSSSDVKEIVLDTIAGLPDNTELAFKVNSLSHPNPTEFTLGGNCVGADGATTPICLATVVFKPKTVGTKTDPIKAEITITKGMIEIEDSLHNAFTAQGLTGQLVNVIYPFIKGYVTDELTNGIEGAMLDPVATATGVGIAGPYTDPSVFVKRQYADFAGGTPTSAQVTNWVKNFEGGGSPIAFVDSLRKGAAWDGKVGPVTRLYSAYFLRSPDTSGITYWVKQSRAGRRLYAISSSFAASSEFIRRYGKLSNADFVKLIYTNVLGRTADSGGLTYWTKQLDSGQTRGRTMVGFSESSEYIRKQANKVAVVEIWFGMLHRAPTPAELTAQSGRLAGGTTVTTLITEVLASAEYRTLILGPAT